MHSFCGRFAREKTGCGTICFHLFSDEIIASIASIATNDNIVSVGASGAVFGMYGLLLGFLVTKYLHFPQQNRQQMMSSIMFFVGFNLFGFCRVNNAAHMGGLISGCSRAVL